MAKDEEREVLERIADSLVSIDESGCALSTQFETFQEKLLAALAEIRDALLERDERQLASYVRLGCATK